MDQSTHEIRRRNWMNIINQCKNRPADITAKQWLADNGISDKSYYYWLRKIRLEAYEQLNVPAVTQSAEVSFAEIPLPTNEDHSSDWNESVSTPVAVIKCGNLSIGLSNDMCICFISFPLAHKSGHKKTELPSYSSAFLSPDCFGTYHESASFTLHRFI